jgi:bcr-type benzoyl-CoA reductase subunit B
MSILRRANYSFWKDAGLPIMLGGDRLRRHVRRRLRKRKPPAWAGPPIECGEKLRSIMSTHYLLAKHAAGAMPVAWVTSGSPVELLRAFGIYTVYPENHGAVCGARKVGVEMSAPAERAGFSPDLCSYARIDIGLAHGAQSPVGRLPRPDLLLCCTNICQTVLYWYKQLAWHYKIPLLLFDTPFISGSLEEHTIQYMAGQMRELIQPLERISGRTFDETRFKEVVERAKRTSLLWGEVLNTVRARPAPMSVFDAFVHMAPVVSLRGLRVAEEYYETLLDELRERVKRGDGALRQERHRLLWDNIAVWFKLGEFSRLFAESGALFVAATYTNAWAETAHLFDSSNPFESAAGAYGLVILNRDLDHRYELMKKMIRDYSIDGVVMHSTRSCKPYSVGQYGLSKRFVDKLGIKCLVIEADTTDPRNYAEGPTRTRIEAFLESLD